MALANARSHPLCAAILIAVVAIWSLHEGRKHRILAKTHAWTNLTQSLKAHQTTMQSIRRSPGLLAGLRICFVSEGLAGPGEYGGIAHAVERQAWLLKTHHAQVDIAYTGVFRTGNASTWKQHYSEMGIRFEFVEHLPSEQAVGSTDMRRAYDVLRWFEQREALERDPYDVVILHDLLGLGLYLLYAKRSGVGLRDTLMIVHAHGAARLSDFYNARIPHQDTLVTYGMERLSIELADVVISPSEFYFSWMLESGYRLGGGHQRLKTIALIPPDDVVFNSGHRYGKIFHPTTFAYYGRMDKLKGLMTFLDALDVLAHHKDGDYQLPQQVVFIGDATVLRVNGRKVNAADYIVERKLQGNWSFDVSVKGHMSPVEAASWFIKDNAAFVNPTNGEVSSTVTVELLHAGVPMITTNVCGIPELSGDRKLFKKWQFSRGDAVALAELMAKAQKHGIAVNMPRIDARTARNLYVSVVLDAVRNMHMQRRAAYTTENKCASEIVGPSRPGLLGKHNTSEQRAQPFLSIGVFLSEDNADFALKLLLSLLQQTDLPSSLDVVVLTANTKHGSALNHLQDVFRSRRVAFRWVYRQDTHRAHQLRHLLMLARGEYFLFLKKTTKLEPSMVESFARAVCATRADVITAFSAGSGGKYVLAAGPVIESSMYNHRAGSSMMIARRTLMLELKDLFLKESAWMDFYAKIILDGRKLAVLPIILQEHEEDRGGREFAQSNAAPIICDAYNIRGEVCIGLSYASQVLRDYTKTD